MSNPNPRVSNHRLFNDRRLQNLKTDIVHTIPNVVLTSIPIAPRGSMVYNIVDDLIYYSTGLVWIGLGSGGGGGGGVEGTGTTVGAVTISLTNAIPVTVDTGCAVESTIVGINSTTNQVNSYFIKTSVKNIGGVTTITAFLDRLEDEEDANASATLAILGSSIVVRVTGSAGNTIVWKSNTVSICQSF